MRIRTIHILILTILVVSCGEGYEKTNDNKWTWVLHSEAGRHIREIDADNATFEILNYQEYAKDKNNVYWRGVKISNADPETFNVITDNGYSKDENNVYLDNDIVIFANPNTFEVMQWPYSKDDKRIFNGNLPMEVDNIQDFEITKSGGGKSSSTKAFFIEWNEEYKWLDTLNINGIIVGENAEAKTKNERYKGYKKIE
ncbi:DKNYY domain-containing protein [Polaribacter batillariae]|uniref:DKNYY domain-containing protein n=1 Tax=Polaribacter batillariae TaxID=2808900 RepID=A0ABX7SSF5_9FLAO|nr:DKNYY domain-containing protein [Polaribacter batillariae]QTD36368.1 DKNYY domain-containing protein [Polaribacter batillariae]